MNTLKYSILTFPPAIFPFIYAGSIAVVINMSKICKVFLNATP